MAVSVDCTFSSSDIQLSITFSGSYYDREFVSCVQSIKILSSVEVQQMSLDGDLGQMPIPNQACSRTNSDNAWRGQYDNNSATSFNR